MAAADVDTAVPPRDAPALLPRGAYDAPCAAAAEPSAADGGLLAAALPAAPAAAARDVSTPLRHAPLDDLNQHWWSPGTTAALVAECLAHGGRAAFLSTPSLYCALPPGPLRRGSTVFDFDRRFADLGANYEFYDFRCPQDLPARHRGVYDFIVVDPPFIAPSVWELYARAIELLAVPGGARVVAATVAENGPWLAARLGLREAPFKPSLPTLVYQFSFFINYESQGLGEANAELP